MGDVKYAVRTRQLSQLDMISVSKLMMITVLIGLITLLGTKEVAHGSYVGEKTSSQEVAPTTITNVTLSEVSNRHRRSQGSRPKKTARPPTRTNKNVTKSTSQNLSNVPSCPIQFVVDLEAYKATSRNDVLDTLRFWKISNSTVDTLRRCKDTYTYENGRLSITRSKPTFYYVFGQITYRNNDPINSFSMLVNDTSICKCVVQNPINTNTTTTCSTGSVVQLQAGLQQLSVHNVEGYFREIATNPEATFWGVYRMN